MIYSKLINKVLKFVYKAHEGAVDQGGIPYVFHPLAVAEQMDDENSTLLALLHDVVEDTNYTFDDIKELGVSDQVIEALRLMTRNKTEFYFDYIDRIKTNPLATKVKLADLKHNSDLTRTDEVNEYDFMRLKKYNKAVEVLKADNNAAICFDCVDVLEEKVKFAVILAKHEGKWVFCQHKNRQTWECPGGHKEPNETILDTARRELYEESGATDFSIKEISVYKTLDNNAYGTLFFADIKSLGELSKEYEMKKVELFDEIPNELTYPKLMKVFLDKVNEQFKNGELRIK